jgi:hypothetical protein
VSSEKISNETPSHSHEEEEHPQVTMKVKFPIRNLSTQETNGQCKSLEFRGDGFQGSRITGEEWQKVVQMFQTSQKLLKAWLSRHRTQMSEKDAVFLEAQLDAIQLERPPSLEEPDLNWRGIGVFTRNSENVPVIRIPVGFVKLALRYQKRAQFEMSRLVAQSWAPCELQAAGIENPWESLLKCLEVAEPQACAAGTYSEGGWAVSSAIAAMVSPPDCPLPAFNSPRKAECLQK